MPSLLSQIVPNKHFLQLECNDKFLLDKITKNGTGQKFRYKFIYRLLFSNKVIFDNLHLPGFNLIQN